MKFFISIGLVLTLSCCLSKGVPTESPVFDMSNFAELMWQNDKNRISENSLFYQLNTADGSDKLFSYFNGAEIYSTKYAYKEVKDICGTYKPKLGNDEVPGNANRMNLVDSFLNKIMITDLMKRAVEEFNKYGFLEGDQLPEETFKADLREAFFGLHEHEEHGPEEGHSINSNVKDSSGFELSFCGELENVTHSKEKVHGLYNWIMFYERENEGLVQYKSTKDSKMVDSNSFLEVVYHWAANGAGDGSLYDGLSGIFCGVSPEFELAMYMGCYYQKRGSHQGENPAECPFDIKNVSFEVHMGLMGDAGAPKRHITETHFESPH